MLLIMLLLKKLACNNFTSPAITWLESYLSNRTQRGFFNGSFSSIRYVQCDVPHGSCLGLLLFSILTKDLPQVLHKARRTKYTDDSTLYMSAPKASELTEILNKELQSVPEWVINNKWVLNTSQTKGIVFGSKHSLRPKPQLELYIKVVAVEASRGS